MEILTEGVGEDEDIIAVENWNGKVNGVDAHFVRMDAEREEKPDSRALEAYVMPDGNDWAWRINCVAALGQGGHTDDCEAIVESFRVQDSNWSTGSN